MFKRQNYDYIEKPAHKRLPADRFSGLAIPVKPRVKSRKAIKEAKAKGICDWCRIAIGDGVALESHHHKTRGAGGYDKDKNLIAMCVGPRSNNCHGKAHSGEIPKAEIKAFIERRKKGWR